MLDNQATTSEMGNELPGYTYDAGAAIYDATGSKIGSLSGLGVQNGYLVVRHGLLLPHDAYVPLGRIARLNPTGIFLNLSGDDLKGLDRDSPPEAAPSSEVGMPSGVTVWNVEALGTQGAQPAGMAQGPTSQRPPLYFQISPSQSTQGTTLTELDDQQTADQLP
jgi:hypothetical protein